MFAHYGISVYLYPLSNGYIRISCPELAFEKDVQDNVYRLHIRMLKLQIERIIAEEGE